MIDLPPVTDHGRALSLLATFLRPRRPPHPRRVRPGRVRVVSRTDLDVPLREAEGETRALLVSLAERYVDSHDRLALDGETTLRDWSEVLASVPAA